MATAAYLDIFIGDQAVFDASKSSYDYTDSLLKRHAEIYGLPTEPSELTVEQQEILTDLSDKPTSLRFQPPDPLLAGRVIIDLDQSPGLSKTRNNFVALCTGEKGQCKNAPNKKLHYLGCPVHRIVKDFVAQGGDVTRGDGSGGESIYGSKFNDDKAGLKNKPSKGCLAMANSGKNSNSSQFFIVLTEDESKLSKLNGKYVFFGKARLSDADGCDALLNRLSGVGSLDGSPNQHVWIGGCGVL